ncbi:MAG: excisionase family DNA-binding protein, partial [Planctomycetota bacterium]
MSAISTAREDVVRDGKSHTRSGYMTTTELAKLCGVSRFTIIKWTNMGKIRANRTVGKHYRIPVSEAMSFLETFRNEKKVVASGSSGHCWEYLQKTNCDKECSNCLIYRREVDYCFEVVRQFGKGVICCKGDCLNCGYFED